MPRANPFRWRWSIWQATSPELPGLDDKTGPPCTLDERFFWEEKTSEDAGNITQEGERERERKRRRKGERDI
jgi:hypothetical protein